jgi:hypothetical protein
MRCLPYLDIFDNLCYYMGKCFVFLPRYEGVRNEPRVPVVDATFSFNTKHLKPYSATRLNRAL